MLPLRSPPDGEHEARRRWGLPKGRGRLVAEPVQGSSWSSDPHSISLFTSVIHFLLDPWKSLALGTSMSRILGTNKGKAASAVIGSFSEEGRDQNSRQVPVPPCTALLPGTSGTWAIPHLPRGGGTSSTHDPLDWVWPPSREGGFVLRSTFQL